MFFLEQNERRGHAALVGRDWPGAEKAFRAVLRWRPRRADLWVRLGHALKEQGAAQAALDCYQRADAIQPGQADTVHQIGRTLDSVGREEDALDRYEAAIALDGSLADAARESRMLRARLQSRRRAQDTGLPESLRCIILGTTGLCNASCVHCPTGKPETAHAPRVPMALDLFQKIIDEVADLGLPITGQVSFGLFGDGLVDPHVLERSRRLKARLPDTLLAVNTNGAAFNRERHAALNDYVYTIALHCESLVPAVYDDLMRPLRAERVFPKFEEILQTFPNKVVVSVPASRRNLKELPDIRSWFLDRGAKEVVFDPLSSRCATDRSVFDALALDPQPIRCPPSIMDELIIDCDGQVLMCCQDFRRAEGIGDLQTQSMVEVLSGLQRRRTRQALADGRHEDFATCSLCYADVRGSADPV